MDLLAAVRAARDLRDSISGPRRSAYDWEHDEEAFHRHFGVPVEIYQEIVARLSDEQARLLEATLSVNPEAAVLWILAMEEAG